VTLLQAPWRQFNYTVLLKYPTDGLGVWQQRVAEEGMTPRRSGVLAKQRASRVMS
jgi:hypothetical protein